MTLRWWRLAARNLFRHRRRTILTGTIVVVGYVAATMTAGFVAQTFGGLKAITIRGQGGHLRVLSAEAAGKTDEEASTMLLDGAEALTASVASDPDDLQAMPRLSFFGLVAHGERSVGYMGTGTVPALEKKATLAAEASIRKLRDRPDAARQVAAAACAVAAADGGHDEEERNAILRICALLILSPQDLDLIAPPRRRS